MILEIIACIGFLYWVFIFGEKYNNYLDCVFKELDEMEVTPL